MRTLRSKPFPLSECYRLLVNRTGTMPVPRMQRYVDGGSYVLYREHAGLANRLRLHCLASAYAKRTGRQLVVDWRRNRFCYAEFHDLFVGGPTSMAALPWRERWALHWEARFNAKTLGAGTLPNGAGVEMMPEYRRRTVILKADIESSVEKGSRLGPYHDEVVRELIPVPEVRQALDRFVPQSEDFRVGIHIRTGDFVRAHGAALPSVDRYLEVARTVLRARPDVRFVLVTDADSRTIARLVSELPMMTREKQNTRTTREGIRDALVDLLALSRTELVVGTPFSSFSGVAAMLGGRPLIRVREGWEDVLERILACRVSPR